MPSQKHYLDEAKTQLLQVSWGGFWKNTVVTLNDTEIMRFADRSELKNGREAMLPDGRMLRVWLDTGVFATQGLMFSINGQPLKGSAADPQTILKTVFYLALFLGVLNIALGLAAEMGEVDVLQNIGIGWISAGVGLVIAFLGFATWKFKSMAALILLISIFVIDMVLSMWLSMEMGSSRTPTTYIGLRIVFIIFFARGFRALRTMNTM